MAVRLSDKSSKTAKKYRKCIFWLFLSFCRTASRLYTLSYIDALRIIQLEILQNFVAFSECMTFIGNVGLIQIPRCLKKDSTHLCTYQQMCLHPHPLYSIMSLIIRMNILRVCMQASVRFLQVCRVVRILGLCEAM